MSSETNNKEVIIITAKVEESVSAPKTSDSPAGQQLPADSKHNPFVIGLVGELINSSQKIQKLHEQVIDSSDAFGKELAHIKVENTKEVQDLVVSISQKFLDEISELLEAYKELQNQVKGVDEIIAGRSSASLTIIPDDKTTKLLRAAKVAVEKGITECLISFQNFLPVLQEEMDELSELIDISRVYVGENPRRERIVSVLESLYPEDLGPEGKQDPEKYKEYLFSELMGGSVASIYTSLGQ